MRDGCSLRDKEWDPSAMTWLAEQGLAARFLAPQAGVGSPSPGCGRVPGDKMGTAGN